MPLILVSRFSNTKETDDTMSRFVFARTKHILTKSKIISVWNRECHAWLTASSADVGVVGPHL